MATKTLGGLLLAALFGAAAGGVVGGLVVGTLSSGSPEAESGAPPAPTRVVELERRVRELERRRPRSRAGGDAPPGRAPGEGAGTGAGAAGDAEGSDSPGAGVASEPGAPRALERQFVDDVEAALRVITERRKAREAEAKRQEQQAKYLRDLDGRLADYQERLGLTDGQIEQVSRLAHEGVAKYMDAQASGASAAELGGIGRSLSRSVRDLVGVDTYRQLRLLDLDRAARPRIADVSSKAGVDAAQRQRIERLLTGHLEGIVDSEVRLRTEEMSDADRARLRTSLDTANRNAWDRIRSDILTEEQRGRVPIRLR